MKLKKVVILFIICLSFICIISEKKCLAADANIESLINSSDMMNVNSATTGGRISQVLNAVIKLIQVAGTGISVIMVTMLGIKYMLASSSEKAEIKKTAMPIIIGCVLLFGAVNLVGIIANIAIQFR